MTPGVLTTSDAPPGEIPRLPPSSFNALTHLVSLYLSDTTLQQDYPLTGSSQALLNWAISPTHATTAISHELKRYHETYQSLALQEERDPSFAPLNAVIVTSPSVTALGATVIGGLKLNVYGLDISANSSKVWVPNQTISDPALTKNPEVISSSIAAVSSPATLRAVAGSTRGEAVSSVGVTQTATSLSATLTSPVKEFVVLRATVPAGSTVTVNGVRTSLIGVDGLWSGVTIPKGRDTIVIQEQQLTVTVLFWFSLTLNVGLVALAVELRITDRGRSEQLHRQTAVT
jgi:hypothetical protein